MPPEPSTHLRRLNKPKHSGEVLEKQLREAFGDRKLGGSSKRLVIPSYDTVRGRIYIFKTAHHQRFKYDIDIPAWNVALATAAAPTYFKAATIPQHHDQGYVDGGVWGNTPALVAVVEAISFLGKRPDEIDVLSIGTTYAPDTVKDLAGAGIFGWGTRVISLLMNAQGEASHKQAMLLVGDASFMRVDCATRPGDYSMDQAKDIDALAAMGRGVAVEKLILERVKAQFLNGIPAAPFVPIHKPK
jgi:patatin-like phospholipase/acyl hydrolase